MSPTDVQSDYETKAAKRIQELEAQIDALTLKAQPEVQDRLASSASLNHRLELTGLYSESIVLSAARRDETYMKEVFNRRKDAEHGMREDALIDALREVDAPVLMEQTSVFRLADKNMNGCVGFDE